MSDRSAVFLQVRLTSSRLPRKALLPLGDDVVIAHAMRALRCVPVTCYALLTDEGSADEVGRVARRCGFELFVGDPDDVLSRFVGAANHFRIDTIVRATGDNPLVSPALARETLSLLRARHADYAGLLGSPYGSGVEVVRAAALRTLHQGGASAYEREHVCPGVYNDGERFSVARERVPQRWYAPDVRVTLDTPKDYERLKALFAALPTDPPLEIEQIMEYEYGRQRSSA